jgi:CheY-like chemotaxis protein
MTRILVVDDSPVDRRLAGRLLEKVPDVEIFYAENGKLGLEQVEDHVPDLVVTDMQMPELDGLELVSTMKKQYPMIPVILMTAAGSEEIAVQALQRGAASYVPKRKLAEELADVAVRVMSMSREQRTQARVLNRMQRWETEFVVENDLQLVLSLSAHLQQNFGGMRICDQAEGLRVGIALEEALLNAFYHGNLEVSSELREQDYQSYYDLAARRCGEAPYQTRKIYVSAKLSRPEAIFTIRDEGPGFNPSELPDPTDPANLERPYGRGLMLMRTFMTDVRYNSTGNEVRLVKRASPSAT